MITQADIEAKIAEFQDPYLRQDWLSSKAIKRVDIQERVVALDITLGYPCQSKLAQWQKSLQQHLQGLLGHRELRLQLNWQVESHVGKSGIKALPNVKNIIAVGSGKGGVGKSTIAVNLALALASEGAGVGLLDADIYGPSQPTMLGVNKRPALVDKKTLEPIIHHGIQSMSIGYLIDEQTPMVWRGPMISTAMQQLLNDTQWQALDYLIIDLPPGTGDIQLTLCQKIPVSAAVIVTTPQDLALSDARRACAMFQKLNVPVLGVVENMSGYTCTQCGHTEHLFGAGGGQKLAQQFAVEVLGRIPLDMKIREMTDSGAPPLIQAPHGPEAQLFGELARSVGAKLSLQQKDYSSKFPKVVVE